MESTKKRTVYLDALRIIACLLVIYNHVAGNSMRLLEGAGGAVALALFYLSKIAVPLFLMVSGAVLLDREESYKRMLGRILRILGVIVIFSLFYYGADCIRAHKGFSVGELFRIMVTSQATTAMWYLYMYLGVLLMLPILQRLAAHMEPRDARYFICLSLLVVGGWPMVQHFLPEAAYNPWFALPLFAVAPGLMIAGRYLAMGENTLHGWQTFLAAALLIVLPLCAMVITWRNPGHFGALDNFFIPTVTIPAICCFLLVRTWGKRIAENERMGTAISRWGRRTFCTYLLADFLRMELDGVRLWLAELAGANIAGMIYTMLIFCLGMLLSLVCTRIPGFKKLV